MTTEVSPVKIMKLRYPGVCSQCSVSIEARTTAAYFRETKTVTCMACYQPSTTVADIEPAQPIPPATSPSEFDSPIQTGEAGGSAQREFARRRANEEKKLRATFGPLGGLAVRLTPARQTTQAWQTGAVGERVVGRNLDELSGPDAVVLHDRRIPRSRANIDHIVVTPQAIWVIDAKHYQGRIREQLRGLFDDPRTILTVGGRDKTALVHSVKKQVDLVQQHVGFAPVRGALCFVDGDWPLFNYRMVFDSVRVTTPRRLVEQIRIGPVPQARRLINVAATAEVIASTFRPA